MSATRPLAPALVAAGVDIHGTADRVVPPGHARAMAAAYRRANLPHELLLLEGEPHGLRRAASVERALQAKLRHHGRLLAAIG